MEKDVLDGIAIGSARGRKNGPLLLEVSRELGVADLGDILNPAGMGSKPAPLARLRHSHHLLARTLSQGVSQEEASLITGYSPSRISILKSDPAFQELMAYYKGQVEAKYLDVHQRLATVGMMALEEIQERLEASPESIPMGQLQTIVSDMMDRSVAPTKGAKGNSQGQPTAVAVKVVFEQPNNAPDQVIDVEVG